MTHIFFDIGEDVALERDLTGLRRPVQGEFTAVAKFDVFHFELPCEPNCLGQQRIARFGRIGEEAGLAEEGQRTQKIAEEPALEPDEGEDARGFAVFPGDQVERSPAEGPLDHALPGPTVIIDTAGVAGDEAIPVGCVFLFGEGDAHRG